MHLLDRMNPIQIPTEEPSEIFPIGSIIEDQNGRFLVLEFEKHKTAHKYKVKVLERFIPIPNHLKVHLRDETTLWILVLSQNLKHIMRVG